MAILGYYWNDAFNGTWQDFLDEGDWLNYTVNDLTVSSEVMTLPIKTIDFSCDDTTYTSESFSVFASRKDYYRSMTDNLPDYYRDSYDIDLFKQMAEVELKELGYKGQQLEQSLHPSLSTSENIGRWEKEYGLTTDKTIGFIFRKNILLANHFAIYNDSTEENLIYVLELIGANDIQIFLTPARSITITLNVNTDLIPEMTKLARKMIGAHLGLIITTSTPWQGVLNNGDWQHSLDNFTWGNYIN